MIILRMEVDGEYMEIERLPAADRKPIQTTTAPRLSDLLPPVGFLNCAPVFESPKRDSPALRRLEMGFLKRKAIHELEETL